MKIDTIIKKILKRTRNTENMMRNINYEVLEDILRTESNTILIDVRSPQEFKEGRIMGAINIPLYELKQKINCISPNKCNTIILYCQSGERSKKAYNILEKCGYSNLYNLDGGLDEL